MVDLPPNMTDPANDQVKEVALLASLLLKEGAIIIVPDIHLGNCARRAKEIGFFFSKLMAELMS